MSRKLVRDRKSLSSRKSSSTRSNTSRDRFRQRSGWNRELSFRRSNALRLPSPGWLILLNQSSDTGAFPLQDRRTVINLLENYPTKCTLPFRTIAVSIRDFG